jgi:type I restriction enzyme S subunit
VVRLQNIGRGKFLDHDKAFVSLDHYDDLKRHSATAGDIVIAALGDGARPAGRACLVPEDLGPALVKADCFRLRVQRDVTIPAYLVHYMNSMECLRRIAEMMRGATRPRVNLEMLRALHVPLAPVPEQLRLLARLNEIEGAIEQARAASEEQAALLKTCRASTFRAAFRGIPPLTIDKMAPFSPAGWHWRVLGDLARLESGHTPSRYHPEWWGGDIPWIALSDIRELDGKVAYETREYTNKAGLANSAARILPAGTVVLSRTASVGFVTVMGRPMATSQDFVNWVCGPDLDPWFLAYLLIASRAYIRSLSSGAIHSTVYVPTAEAFRVCVPPLDEQKRTAARLKGQLAELDRIAERLSEQRDAIAALPAALLRQTFNGTL